MKNVIYLLLAMILTGLLTAGCQEESVVIIEPPLENGFTVNTSVAEFVERVTLRDGSDDNILSNGSCFSFVLPVTVVVNGSELVIESEDDLGLVEYLIDEYDDDEDEIRVIFPVTIILADYTRIQINSPEVLEEYIDECEEGGVDEDIECVDFNYPVQVSVYDTRNQVSDVVTLSNDEQLYVFLNEQDDDVFMSFIFPLTLIFNDGTEVQVNNLDELEAAIDSADDSCDEDDDNDFDDDDVDDSNFRDVLLSGDWIITNYTDEGDDETSDYAGWKFNFQANGAITATNGTQTVNGTWISSGDDGVIELEMLFPETSILDEISEDWDLVSFTSEKIELSDDGENFLVFSKQ